ncbi:MAG: NAD(P)H-dependent oxidoreductase subunit E [Candidatus Diapherotrites archaeon]|nr:NAD(P)H-dependent oxidoreductase subunit E [Candidatus Diapherotrites archaeon]
MVSKIRKNIMREDVELPRKKSKVLMNILWEAQEKYGYLSEHVLKQISVEHKIPIAKLWGVVKFYSMFRTEPVGKYVIEICSSPSCVLNGSNTLEEVLKNEIGARTGQTSKDRLFTLYKTSCIGLCDEAPAMLINGKPYTKLTEARIKKIIAKLREKANANIEKN